MKADTAVALAAAHAIPLGADFHALPSDTVARILAAADAHRYRAPRNANGSRARSFYAALNRAPAPPNRAPDTMPKKKRTPLVLSPREEFECEARITGAHAAEQMTEDDTFTRADAVALIHRDAEHLAPFYEMPAADFVAVAIAYLPPA